MIIAKNCISDKMYRKYLPKENIKVGDILVWPKIKSFYLVLFVCNKQKEIDLYCLHSDVEIIGKHHPGYTFNKKKIFVLAV